MRAINILLIIILFYGISFAQHVPYKNSNEFEVFSSFQWVQEIPEKRPDYVAGPTKRYDGKPEMYLNVKVKILKINGDEVRIIAKNNNNITKFRKRIREGLEMEFEFGKFENVKNRKNPYLFTIFILNKKKEKVSKIIIEVLENGAVFVNGKPHGAK
jgi:sRNA-binding carbon storage regulator CsrA